MAKLVHEKNRLLTRKEERKAHKYIKRWDKLFWLKMWRNGLIESAVNIKKRRYRMMYKANRQIAIARRKKEGHHGQGTSQEVQAGYEGDPSIESGKSPKVRIFAPYG